MKKVIVIGAGGSLAAYVIDALQKHGNVSLTLFLRNANQLNKSAIKNSRIIEGDVLDYTLLKNAVSGQDIVYINLAGDLEKMATTVLRSMQETGVKRVIAISSIGIYSIPLKPILIPYRRLADIIEQSGLDYTIIRPSWFTGADEIDYEITYKGEPEKGSLISRKSIAALVAGIVQKPDLYLCENISINKPNS